MLLFIFTWRIAYLQIGHKKIFIQYLYRKFNS